MFYLCFCYNAHRLHTRQRFKLVHVAENVQQRPLGSHFGGTYHMSPTFKRTAHYLIKAYYYQLL